MRDLLVLAAEVSEHSDAADQALDDFQQGEMTALETGLALSLAYVTCARAMKLLARRMAELEHDSFTIKEAA